MTSTNGVPESPDPVQQLRATGIASVPLSQRLETAFPKLRDIANALFSRVRDYEEHTQWADDFGPLGFRRVVAPSGDENFQFNFTHSVLAQSQLETAAGKERGLYSDQLLDAFNELLQIATKILTSIAQSTDLRPALGTISLENAASLDGSTLRLVRYRHTSDESKEWIWAREHIDFGLVTLVLPLDGQGLQYQSCDGSWSFAPDDNGPLIAMVGELLSNWTGEHGFPVCRHRVIGRSTQTSRTSLILFPHPSIEDILPGYVVPEFLRTVPSENSITGGEYLNRRLKYAELQRVLLQGDAGQ